MKWLVVFHGEFDVEFDMWDAAVREELLARAKVLA